MLLGIPYSKFTVRTYTNIYRGHESCFPQYSIPFPRPLSVVPFPCCTNCLTIALEMGTDKLGKKLI